jgi:hypothetical protein
VDYAFAPGRTEYDGLMRQLFTDRPNTQLISVRGAGTIADFLNNLETAAGITKPTGDLFIATHGNDKAWIQIGLDAASPNDTQYEVVDAAVASGSVNIPTDINHDSNGDLTDLSVNIRGCRIGAAAAEPFVDRLKTAFGDESPVTAPRWFHYVYQMNGIGMMEFLLYCFEVRQSTAFPDKAAVAAALDAEDFTYHDGTDVHTAQWDSWVPRNVGPGHRNSMSVYLNLGRTIGKQSKIRRSIEFRHDRVKYVYSISGLGAMPAKAAQPTTLQSALQADASQPGSSFADDYGFPVFKRYGFDTLDDFFNGLAWSFSWDNAKKVMICTGRLHEYIVLIPITDPPDLSTGKLIYNFYPQPGTSGTSFNELSTSDDTLFYTS